MVPGNKRVIALNRRQLIGGSATLATGFAVGRYFARAADGYPFTLGVASGEPTHDGFVLWTRLAPTPLALDGSGGISKPVSVTWEVATDDAMRNVVRTGIAEADRRFAHSLHVEVDGLQAGRPYWYRFTALGQQSPIGRTKTAPAASAEPERMRFAFASCSHWEVGYFSAYRHMAEENPDLVIFLGDYIYEHTYPDAQADRIVRKHDGPTASDLASYRNRYALYRTDADLQALHGAAPCLMTWDDHEVENDYANAWSERMETDPQDFLHRRADLSGLLRALPTRRARYHKGSDCAFMSASDLGSL
jgi:alkaline phosphatase D